MRHRCQLVLLIGSLCGVFPVLAIAGNWGQFRGPNAAGRAERDEKLPDAVGPETNVIWKREFPAGHSSPAIFGDRLYLTAERDDQLLTICLDRQTGRELWQAAAPHAVLEKIHDTASHATPSPATDGK
ncbi:MAG: pyrrolo-quinoline quinone, partial [Planctomycetes bacterium]|nr:pyrrolo-quinoline quinone [Planctomycetota bacterium]